MTAEPLPEGRFDLVHAVGSANRSAGSGLLGLGLVDAAELERFHALMRDGDTVCFAPLMVSAYGRRP